MYTFIYRYFMFSVPVKAHPLACCFSRSIAKELAIFSRDYLSNDWMWEQQTERLVVPILKDGLTSSDELYLFFSHNHGSARTKLIYQSSIFHVPSTLTWTLSLEQYAECLVEDLMGVMRQPLKSIRPWEQQGPKVCQIAPICTWPRRTVMYVR